MCVCCHPQIFVYGSELRWEGNKNTMFPQSGFPRFSGFPSSWGWQDINKEALPHWLSSTRWGCGLAPSQQNTPAATEAAQDRRPQRLFSSIDSEETWCPAPVSTSSSSLSVFGLQYLCVALTSRAPRGGDARSLTRFISSGVGRRISSGATQRQTPTAWKMSCTR